MKKWSLLFLLLCLLPAMTLGETTVMVVTDTHLLAPALYADSKLFLQALALGDGKYVQASDILLEALLRQTARIRPDVLVITGDLSLNGEKASHMYLADGLKRLEEMDIPVYVLPGNHDINCQAVQYLPYSWTPAENVDASGFAEIYRDFLPERTREDIGFSGIVPVGDDIALLLLDCAYYEPEAQTFGFCDIARLEWAEEALQSLTGRTVLSMTHHSVVPHTSLWSENYVIYNNHLLMERLAKGHVSMHLSGHLHIQHIAEKDGLFDIAQSAFSLWPHRYGLVRITGTGMAYESCTLDADLLPDGFHDRSRQWFWDTAWSKTSRSLNGLDLTEEEKRAMLDFACRLNLAYFSGELRLKDADVWKSDEAYSLWKSYQEQLSFAAYLDMILSEASPDPLSLQLQR